MSRPRIRTVKPEIWQDEKVGDLSYGARLLMLGLLTMADDEGRLRALPALISGHVFPYDDVPPAKLKHWIGEVEGTGLVLTYTVDAKPYIAFRHWARHQKVNRPTASSLPEPPDPQVVSDNALRDHGEFSETSVKEQGAVTEDSQPHAQARGSDPFPSLSVPSVSSSEQQKQQKKKQLSVNRKPVTEKEYELGSEIIEAFNAEAGSDYTFEAHFIPIVGRIREKPDLTADQHRAILAATFRAPWWEGHAGPEVVYGKASQFEKAMQALHPNPVQRNRDEMAGIVNARRLQAKVEENERKGIQ